MPNPDLEFFDKRGVAIKAETTEGTDATPDPAVDGLLLLDGSSGIEQDTVERNIDRPHFTNNPFAVSNRRAFIEGDIELLPPETPGDATDGIPHHDVALRTAALARTFEEPGVDPGKTIYSPISSGIITASSYWWHASSHKKVLGVRSNLSNLRMEIGEIPMGRLRMLGTFDDVEKEAVPNIILPDFNPVSLTAENGLTLFTCEAETIEDLELWAKGLSIDFGNELATKEYTSLRRNMISGRAGTFSLRMAPTDLAVMNPWTLHKRNRIIETTISQDYTDLNIRISLSIRGQIENIEETDIDGDYGWNVTGRCIASTTGGDEFGLTYAQITA